MSGDPNNVSIWADAEVWVAPLGTALPADASAAFPVGWVAVGLLDGDQGFEESREEDKKEFFAWGGTLIGISRSKFKLTKKFTTYEDNVTTRALAWPGSTATSTIVPVPIDQLIAFETSKGGKVRRKIASYKAQVELDGSTAEKETDPASMGFIATIFPNPTTKEIFVEQGKPNIVSIALSPLTLALTTGLNKFVQAVATYSDATTANVSAQALWTSSAPTKATVVASSAGGVVSWVSAGSTNVSCTFGGITATAPVVVTCT